MVRLYSGDVPVDLLAPRDAQEEEALTRRRMIEVEGLSLRTISPEDLVLMKLKTGGRTISGMSRRSLCVRATRWTLNICSVGRSDSVWSMNWPTCSIDLLD